MCGIRSFHHLYINNPISKSLRLKKSSPLYDTACFKRNHIKQLCRPPLTIFVHIKLQKGARGANKYSVPVSLSTITSSILNCFKPCMHELALSRENYHPIQFYQINSVGYAFFCRLLLFDPNISPLNSYF